MSVRSPPASPNQRAVNFGSNIDIVKTTGIIRLGFPPKSSGIKFGIPE